MSQLTISRKTQIDMTSIDAFLLCPTPKSWLLEAKQPKNLPILLIDHANCEKKAASNALSLIYRYTDNYHLLQKMSRLAREELHHFEQVIALLKQYNITYTHVSPARYAQILKTDIRTYEPQKLLDTLIVGAIIEARSCERFYRLLSYLPEDIAQFYIQLINSEARHYQDYLTLAKNVSASDFTSRIQHFLLIERKLIDTPDTVFRFHSGPLTEVPSSPVVTL